MRPVGSATTTMLDSRSAVTSATGDPPLGAGERGRCGAEQQRRGGCGGEELASVHARTTARPAPEVPGPFGRDRRTGDETVRKEDSMKRLAALIAARSGPRRLRRVRRRVGTGRPPPTAQRLSSPVRRRPPGQASEPPTAPRASSSGGHELLRFDPATRKQTRSYDLGGAWKLEGVSANGRWVGLTRAGHGDPRPRRQDRDGRGRARAQRRLRRRDDLGRRRLPLRCSRTSSTAPTSVRGYDLVTGSRSAPRLAREEGPDAQDAGPCRAGRCFAGRRVAADALRQHADEHRVRPRAQPRRPSRRSASCCRRARSATRATSGSGP